MSIVSIATSDTNQTADTYLGSINLNSNIIMYTLGTVTKIVSQVDRNITQRDSTRSCAAKTTHSLNHERFWDITRISCIVSLRELNIIQCQVADSQISSRTDEANTLDIVYKIVQVDVRDSMLVTINCYSLQICTFFQVADDFAGYKIVKIG